MAEEEDDDEGELDEDDDEQNAPLAPGLLGRSLDVGLWRCKRLSDSNPS